MIYVLLFLAGALTCNALPHLAAGLRGEPFPTPFAKPPGEGHSSPMVNFIWGSANLFAGVALAVWRWPLVDTWPGLAAMAAGWLAIGLFCSHHFAQVRARRNG